MNQVWRPKSDQSIELSLSKHQCDDDGGDGYDGDDDDDDGDDDLGGGLVEVIMEISFLQRCLRNSILEGCLKDFYSVSAICSEGM